MREWHQYDLHLYRTTSARGQQLLKECDELPRHRPGDDGGVPAPSRRPYAKPDPLCELFPPMSGDQFAEFLVASIRERGFDPAFPIVTYEGQILDGANRWRAVGEGLRGAGHARVQGR